METINLTEVSQESVINHTSKGNQPKWKIKNKWYKADYLGYESLAEVVVSELLKLSNVEAFVTYSPVYILDKEKNHIGCTSIDFRGKNKHIFPLEKLHRLSNGMGLAQALSLQAGTQEKIEYMVTFVSSLTGIENAGKYISMLVAVDAFFLNEDRHTNNIAVMRDENTKNFSFTPVFDNGLALLADTKDFALDGDAYEYIERVIAKPFNKSFDEQLEIVEELYGRQLKLYFTKSDVRKILKQFEGVYDDKILNRVETILYNQMRKYSYMFSNAK